MDDSAHAHPGTHPAGEQPAPPPARSETGGTQQTFFEAAGGEETFHRLVHDFYRRVAGDPELRRVYPSKDLQPAEDHLRMFLIQYWGGPDAYSQRRGHPRLRMRHARFHVGEAERDAWLGHMRAALDEIALPETLDRQLWNYLVMAAHSLVNQPSEPPDGHHGLTIAP